MTGYLHPLYSASLSEFGRPVQLPSSGGWLLERAIPKSSRADAMGCYPLFCCLDWSKLKLDLDALAGKYVAISLVTDPFAPVTANELAQAFDVARPFKEHFTVDLSLANEAHVSRHHRYYARQSLRKLNVVEVSDPASCLDQWMQLYDFLIARHQLKAIKAFSRQSFRAQLKIPGLVMFMATNGSEAVGAQLWFVQGAVAYSHLTAVNENGYSLRATYAIYSTAIEFFKNRFRGQLHWLDLGGGAGVSAGGSDGLADFKRGWSSGTRTKYFCGRICQPESYAALAEGTAANNGAYFPAYRAGEMA